MKENTKFKSNKGPVKVIGLRTEEEIFDVLEKERLKKNMSMNNFVNMIIEKWLSTSKKSEKATNG